MEARPRRLGPGEERHPAQGWRAEGEEREGFIAEEPPPGPWMPRQDRRVQAHLVGQTVGSVDTERKQCGFGPPREDCLGGQGRAAAGREGR